MRRYHSYQIKLVPPKTTYGEWQLSCCDDGADEPEGVFLRFKHFRFRNLQDSETVYIGDMEGELVIDSENLIEITDFWDGTVTFRELINS